MRAARGNVTLDAGFRFCVSSVSSFGSSRSKFLSDKWMVQKGFLSEEDIMVNKPWYA